MVNWLELSPIDGRKSFYKKAHVAYAGGVYYCKSYNTIVCEYCPTNQTLVKLWPGYSATSMRHINAFMQYLGFDLGGKSWWTSLPVNVPVKLVDVC